MPALTAGNFTQFYDSTRPTAMTSPETLINMSQRAQYVVPALVRGKKAGDLIRPVGDGLEETVHLADNGSFAFFNPGDPMAYPPASTTRKFKHTYRMGRSQIKWTDDEVRRNTGGERERFKSFKAIKEQERVTSFVNGLDRCVFSKPNPDLMEPLVPTGDPGLPFSIPAIVAESAQSSNPSAVPILDRITYPVGTTWSATQATLMGLNPVSDDFWKSLQISYDEANPTLGAGLIPALDMATLLLRQWAHPDAGNTMQSRMTSELICFTNSDGVNRAKDIYRKAQDRWVNPKDPAMDFPTFDGIEIAWAPQLDSELLGTNAGKTAYTSTPYKAGRARYFLINRKYLKVCMDGTNGERTVLPKSPLYPDTTFVVTASYIQFLTNHRGAHALVCPGANASD